MQKHDITYQTGRVSKHLRLKEYTLCGRFYQFCVKNIVWTDANRLILHTHCHLQSLELITVAVLASLFCTFWCKSADRWSLLQNAVIAIRPRYDSVNYRGRSLRCVCSFFVSCNPREHGLSISSPPSTSPQLLR